MVDNNNIKESEYIHFIEFAHKERYIASVVTLPAPIDLETAAQRASKPVTVSELTKMMSMYEPLSLSILSKKGVEMHEAGLSGRQTPRRDAGGENRGNVSSRHSSSQYRGIPTDTIAEDVREGEGEGE